MKSQKSSIFENSTNSVRASKGQAGIGLVILGVVAIIAVIGLVLLFTRASSEGAVVTHGGYGTARGGIGTSYGWDRNIGISQGYPVSVVAPGSRGPEIQRPAYLPSEGVYLVGSRLFPSWLAQASTPGSVAGLEDIYGKCRDDLTFKGRMAVELWDPFAQRNWQGGTATGRYPGAGSALTREPIASPQGSREGYPSIGRTGGDVYVWANLGGLGDGTQTQKQLNEGVRSKVNGLVRSGALEGSSGHSWSFVNVRNIEGEEAQVAVCRAGEYEWPYRQ